MREALAITAEEGLKEQWQRHEAMHHMLWDGLKSMGLKSFVENDSERLITVNTIKVASLSSVNDTLPPSADCPGVLCTQPLQGMLLSPLVYAHRSCCHCHCKADKTHEQAKHAFHGHEFDDLLPVVFGPPFWFNLWHEKRRHGYNCGAAACGQCQLICLCRKQTLHLATVQAPRPHHFNRKHCNCTTLLQHCPLVHWDIAQLQFHLFHLDLGSCCTVSPLACCCRCLRE